MPLKLIIENATSLPDGGPLSYTFNGTGRIVIGRDQYLDWTLPDASRAISSKHCEVRWQNGGYWLHDLSTNGTFVNQSLQRMVEPQRLRSGDLLYIGHYIVRVHMDGESVSEPVAPSQPIQRDHRTSDPWESTGDAAPPIERNSLRPLPGPVVGDYSDHFHELPPLIAGPRGNAPPLPPLYADPSEGDWSSPQRPVAPPPTRSGVGSASSPERFDDPWRPFGVGGSLRRDGSALDMVSQAPEPNFTMPTSGPMPGPETAAPRPTSGGGMDAFVERFAKGAGVAPEVFAWRDPGDLAEELGALTRLSVENLKQLLIARAEAKRVARASSQTMIQALDNNPLKFTPTTEDALRILFGRPTSGYLTGRRALDEGFRDLKSHQVKVYSAMQHALRLLLQDLDPESIEASLGDDRGLGAVFGSRKARLWDLYATRWDAMTAPHEDGIVDAFMVFFSECYDRNERE
ncbi:type VI secretion system-associated FHA domain protein TagH [Methylorubrum aminovorans]